MMKLIAYLLISVVAYILVTGLYAASPALFSLLLAFFLFKDGKVGFGCLAVIVFILVLIFS